MVDGSRDEGAFVKLMIPMSTSGILTVEILTPGRPLGAVSRRIVQGA